MKKIGLMFVLFMFLTVAVGMASENGMMILGGQTMDSAVLLKDHEFAKEIIGNYNNDGLNIKQWQLEGWYTFTVPSDGTCSVRVKSYNDFVCWFDLMDSNGNRLKRDVFGGNGSTPAWKQYTLEAKAGERYYLHFTRNSSAKNWGCMFTVCAEDRHKTGMVETVLQDATCVENGVLGYQCELCGERIISGYLSKKGHQTGINKVIQEATCLQKGIMGTLCSSCGEVISRSEVPLQNHTPGVFTDVQKATCMTEGIRVQYCTVCQATLNTERIPAYGHRESEWKQSRMETCTNSGLMEKRCMDCGAIIAVNEVPAKNHQYSEWTITIEPTKQSEGEQCRICNLCGAYQVEKIPKIEKFLFFF